MYLLLVLVFAVFSYPSEGLECFTCINMFFPTESKRKLMESRNLTIFDNNCKSNPNSENSYKQKCSHDENVCAEFLVSDNLQNSILLKSCLAVEPSRTIGEIFYSGADHEDFAKQKSGGLYLKNETVSIRLKVCDNDLCVPPSDPFYLEAQETNKTLNVLRSLYFRFRNISSLQYQSKWKDLLDRERNPKVLVNTTDRINADNSSTTTATPSTLPSSTSISTKTHSNQDKLSERSPKTTQTQVPPVVMILLPAVILTCLFLTIIIILVRRHRTDRKNKVEQEFTKYLNNKIKRNTVFSKTKKDRIDGGYNRQVFEVPVECLEIDESKLMYSGDYEKICQGIIIRDDIVIEVGAKMPKVPTSPEITLVAVRRLIQEIKVLSFIGSHENVIKFVGAYTENLRNGWVCVFLEACINGCLQDTLTSFSSDVIDDLLNEECGIKLNLWTMQISEGMEYLASAHVVHADLCTKNILLDSSQTAKIANFGLSRVIQLNGNIIKQNLEPTSWQWMAPEALRNQQFTEKTDVWAYGVVIWEIYSLGAEPYPGLAWPSNFATQLERGVKLEKPKYISEQMFELMLKCWEVTPEGRPGFMDIQEILLNSASLST